MFESPAYAQGNAAAGAAGGGMAAFAQLLPLLLIFVVGYFMLIRPQQKQRKMHQAMLEAMKRNDIVVTNGGLIGKVIKVDGAEVEVEIAKDVRVRVMRPMISEVRPHGAKPAND